MKKLLVIIMVAVTIIIYTSCQQIFTYSVLEWAQRDPANLPEAQQIAYAESILSSGDTEEMAEAYEVIDDLVTANPDDVELRLLAADLAIGGSGITDAIENLDLENLDTSVETILDSIDLALVVASADHVIAAEILDPAAISPDQYLNTGLILLANAANDAGGFAGLNAITIGGGVEAGELDLIQAEDFIVKGGGNIADYGITVIFP